jgi:hypothetical protein
MPALILACLQGGGWFERREVDFWGTRRAAPAAELWADSPAPAPVKRLLETPTVGTARAYLAWQKERMDRLRAAMAAVEAARAEPGPILYFARPGCPWCVLQERELEGLPVVRVPEGSPLWREHGVDAVPTLVAGGRVFRGFTRRSLLTPEAARE